MSAPRVLVVGAGSIGERHARCFLSAGVPSVSVVELREQRRAELRERYPLDEIFASLDDVTMADFGVVVVCVPAHLHVDVSIRALDAGCHVFVEKPLALSLDEADRLLDAAAKSGRVTGVAYVYRHIPPVVRLRELLCSGAIGPVRHICTALGQHFPQFRPDFREIYFRSHATGGGTIHDALTHVVNCVQWCVGLEQYVTCRAEHLVLPDIEVEDTAMITLRTPGERLASLNLNQFQLNNDGWMEFAGEVGTLRYEMAGARCGLYKDGEWTWESHPFERDDTFVSEAKNFLAAVEGREAVTCTLEEGYETLRTILAAHESVRSGREIKVR